MSDLPPSIGPSLSECLIILLNGETTVQLVVRGETLRIKFTTVDKSLFLIFPTLLVNSGTVVVIDSFTSK